MKRFVFWTGVYNIVGGATFLIPGMASFLGVRVPASDFWLWTVSAVIIYTGVAIVLSSRDLPGRASVVYWEGILRLAAFLLFSGFGFLGGLGAVLGVLGIVDLVIGLVYLIGLPKALDMSAADLLLDRRA